jgi:hypothetical protein
MKSYVKLDSGLIIGIETKRQYDFSQLQHDGTITTIGDTSRPDKYILVNKIVEIIENNANKA